MSQSEYTVNINVVARDQTSGAAKTATKSLDGLQKTAKIAAVAFAALRAAQKALEFVKFGASVDRAARAFENLAAAAGSSGDAILKEIRTASDYTIDRMAAMESANRAMVMGVAKTPAEFERLTRVAVSLGRAMGVDAVQSIDNFVTAGGRQSMMIADNLGLIVRVEEAQKNYAAQLGKTVDALTEEEKRHAFVNEMLIQGEAKLADLGDTTEGAATSWERLTAALSDAKTAMAEDMAQSDALNAALDGTASAIRSVTETMTEQATVYPDFNANLLEAQAYLNGENMALFEGVTALETYAEATEIARYAHLQQKETIQEAADAVDRGVLAFADFGDTQQQLEFKILATSAALNVQKAALEEQTKAAQDAALEQLNLSARLVDASDAMIAQTAIGQLGQALEDGTITFDDYKTAVSETQLAFGLATPESIALSEGVLGLTTSLADGELKASDYNEALAAMIMKAQAGTAATGDLRAELELLPEKKTIDIEVRYHTSGAPPGVPGMQYGGSVRGGMPYIVGERGPELFVPGSGGQVISNDRSRHITNNFSQTIHTQTGQDDALRGFRFLQMMAG